MIKIKAKQDSVQKQPSREDYEQEERKTNIIPLAFLLLLTGCAAYLKSFLPVRLESPDRLTADKAAQRREDENGRSPVPDTVAAEIDGEDDTAGTVGRTKRSSDNVVPLEVRSSDVGAFLASDSPALDFSAMRRQPFSRSDFGSSSDPGRPVNDNQSRPAGSSGPSSPPHPGGGGGGGSSDPGPKNPPGPEGSRNRAPRSTGPVQLQDVVGCRAYLISVLALLQGTTDPDGDQLTLRNLSASSGTLTRTEDGGWSFTPAKGMLGDVTLTYYISDGAEVIQQTAHFKVIEDPPIVGTAGDDNLLGTQCADVIDGRGGNDNIDTRGGDDLVFGGEGQDHIVAGAGNDIVYAAGGNDIVFGGAGNDVIFGGEGHDRLFGDQGDDTIYGEAGDDHVAGGEGNDILLAGIGNDVVQGDTGNDSLDGGEGNDDLQGGIGNDVLFAGSGDDVASGGAGNDVILDGEGKDDVRGNDGDDYVIAANDAVSDSYSGDAGEDTIDYSKATLSITVDLRRGNAEGREIGMDLIAGFERIIAGQGDDRIVAGSAPATLTGGDGDDTFEFERSDDDHQLDVVRRITDFTVGDRIIAARYELRYREGDSVSDVIEDVFEDVYLSDDDDHNRPVRFRFEKVDDDERTFVEVHDRPDSEEFFLIELYGHHNLSVVVGVS